MSPTTRRRLFLALLLLALTIPAETILLKAIATPDQRESAQQWAADLDSQQINAAAANIQAYPYAYRRAIMTQLSPERRSSVWRSHVDSYVAAHPELDGTARDVLKAAQSALTPAVLSDRGSDADEKALAAAADQVVSVLGDDTAKYLLGYLGSRETTFASAEPLSMKLADFVRRSFTVFARQADCDCTPNWSCDYGYCSTAVHCSPYSSWPACGWGWSQTCNGGCTMF